MLALVATDASRSCVRSTSRKVHQMGVMVEAAEASISKLSRALLACTNLLVEE